MYGVAMGEVPVAAREGGATPTKLLAQGDAVLSFQAAASSESRGGLQVLISAAARETGPLCASRLPLEVFLTLPPPPPSKQSPPPPTPAAAVLLQPTHHHTLQVPTLYSFLLPLLPPPAATDEEKKR